MSTDNMSEATGKIMLPALDSREALVYCGFAEDAATTIYSRWNLPEVREEFNLFEFAVKYLRSHNIDDCGGTEDDWDAYLQKCGANDQVRAAITDDGDDGELEDVRYSETALYWFIYSLESKYGFLECFYRARADDQERQTGEQQQGQEGNA